MNMEQQLQLAPIAPWMDDFLDFSATRRSLHRRTVSDPIAFVEEQDDQLHNIFSDNDDNTTPTQPEPEPEPTPPPQTNSNSSDDPKRMKRILANRQSAQRSRVRKLHYISELERSVTTLQTEVSALSPRVAYLDHQRLLLNVDNNALKQRIAALAQDKIFKDAHQEALKKEIERLRRIFHEQNMKNNERLDG